jgi:hypothetical protein
LISSIDFFNRGFAFGDELEVNHRDIRGRHAHGEAVQLAVEFRQHQADSFGSAG